ncbi:MAG: hypothetical protein AAFR15_15735 [Cyanobacteria bacterium J06627_15]
MSEKLVAIALLPVRFLVRLPGLSVQLSRFFLSEVFTRPTVLAAVLLHGGLLVLPALELSEPEPEELNAPEEEEEPIEVQSLGDLIAASPEAEAPPPEQPAAPPPEAPPPVQQQQVITEVPPDLPPEELPPLEDVPPESEFEEEIPPEEPPPEETLPYDAGATRSQFQQFAGNSGYKDEVGAPTFQKADRPFFFISDDTDRNGNPDYSLFAPRVDGIIAMYYLDLVSLFDAYPQAEALAKGSGLTPASMGSYANGDLFQLADADGNVPMYMSLITARDSDSSIIVLWDRNPNGG